MKLLSLLVVTLVACAPHPLRRSTLPLTVVEVAQPEADPAPDSPDDPDPDPDAPQQRRESPR